MISRLKNNKLTFILLAMSIGAFVLGTKFAGNVSAQSNSSWSQCSDGRAIARCQTYDCPQGDTNNDGKCTLEDTKARLTDARNDSLCANPTSGCGQINYFPSGSSTSCISHIEEGTLNCDLYAVASPSFTPKPTASPSTVSKCVSLTASPKSGKSPLAVSFTATATDPDGSIKEYDFEIDKPGTDTNGHVVQAGNKLSQTFTDNGTYTVRVTATDSKGKKVTSDACVAKVIVGDTAASELPKTGPDDMWIGFAVVAVGMLGVFVYERYRTI